MGTYTIYVCTNRTTQKYYNCEFINVNTNCTIRNNLQFHSSIKQMRMHCSNVVACGCDRGRGCLFHLMGPICEKKQIKSENGIDFVPGHRRWNEENLNNGKSFIVASILFKRVKKMRKIICRCHGVQWTYAESVTNKYIIMRMRKKGETLVMTTWRNKQLNMSH